MSSSDFAFSSEGAEQERNLIPQQSPPCSSAGIESYLGDPTISDDSPDEKDPPSLGRDSISSPTDSFSSAHELCVDDHLDNPFDNPALPPLDASGLAQIHALTENALQAHNDYGAQNLDDHDLPSWDDDGNVVGRPGFESDSGPGSNYFHETRSKYSNTPPSTSSPLRYNRYRTRGRGVENVDFYHDPSNSENQLEDGMGDSEAEGDSLNRYRRYHENSLDRFQQTVNQIFGGGYASQPRAVPQEGRWRQGHSPSPFPRQPVHSEHGNPEVGEQDEGTRSPHHPWIVAIWCRLTRMIDPPPKGAYRATYTCGCGELCYMDVEDLVPGGAVELEQDIRREAALVRCHKIGSRIQPGENIQPPPPVCLATSTLLNSGAQGVPAQNLPALGEHTQNDTAGITAQDLPSDISSIKRKYLLLCVNTKHGLVKLVHIDVSTQTNDQYLFEEIRNEYTTARTGHDWNLALMIPGKTIIWKPTLAFLSMIFSRNIALPQWMIWALQESRIFVPRRIEFVKVKTTSTISPGYYELTSDIIQFELMPVRLEIYAGNIEKPEIPGAEEVQINKTYEYEPITIKAKILNVPLHELLKPGQHLNRYWWKRFPKKLDSPLTFDEELNCCGWGILITEGLNRPLVIFLCLLAMIVFVIFVALYSALANDGSRGVGIGSFMMAILALYCTLKYEQWKEQ